MEFIQGKCELLHFERSNIKGKYAVNGRILGNIDINMDLGVQVHSSLNGVTRRDRMINKLDGMLAFISQTLSIKVWKSHCSCIELWLGHTDYLVQFWSPLYRMSNNLPAHLFHQPLPGFHIGLLSHLRSHKTRLGIWRNKEMQMLES